MSATEQTTTLAALKPQRPTSAVRAGFFDLDGFELLQRVSKAFASSTLVPKQYQGDVANCMIALNLARRLDADELMVMQNLYIVHGNPGWSSKFLIASVNTCGRYTTMRYEWRGNPGDEHYGCRAWAKEISTNEKLVGIWVDWKMVKAEGWDSKNGSKWKTMPDQMFIYRSAAFWQRAYAPEISMGMGTKEELEDVIDMREDGSFTITTAELRGALKDVDQETGEIHQQNTAHGANTSGAEAGTAAGPASETSSQATQTNAEDTTTLTYAQVVDAMQKSTSLDVLQVAIEMISQVANPEQQDELRGISKEHLKRLTPKPAAKRAAAADPGVRME